MATPDTPAKVDLVLGNLKKEVEAKRPDDYIIGLPNGQKVTFKYPMIYKRTERETFSKLITDALREGNEQPLLERMLSAEDLEKYNAEDLDDDVHLAVISKIGEHFKLERDLAEEGKGSASDLL